MDDEERHPLLDEIRQGLGQIGGQQVQTNQMNVPNQANDSNISTAQQGQTSSSTAQSLSPEIKQFQASLSSPGAGKFDDKTKEEMGRILSELKQKMADIDALKMDLEKKRRELEKAAPIKTERILQEIKVPPLEMLK
jgi:hypothetical protein